MSFAFNIPFKVERGGGGPVARYTGVELVGGATLSDDGILGSLNAAGRYGRLPFHVSLGTATWEANIRCNYTGGNGGLGGVGTANGWTPVYYLENETPSRITSYLNGVGWPVQYVGIASLPFGNHSVRVSFDLNTYRLSVDGGTKSTFQSSAFCNNELVTYTMLGGNRGSNPFNGTFDLTECYIKIGDELMWEGVAGAYRKANTI